VQHAPLDSTAQMMLVPGLATVLHAEPFQFSVSVCACAA